MSHSSGQLTVVCMRQGCKLYEKVLGPVLWTSKQVAQYNTGHSLISAFVLGSYITNKTLKYAPDSNQLV